MVKKEMVVNLLLCFCHEALSGVQYLPLDLDMEVIQGFENAVRGGLAVSFWDQYTHQRKKFDPSFLVHVPSNFQLSETVSTRCILS